MSADGIGLTSLLVVAGLVALVAWRLPQLKAILWGAYVLRALASLAYHYVIPLPGMEADRIRFDLYAWQWAQQEPTFAFPQDYLISGVVSMLYRVVGHSPLAAQSLSLLCGLGCVVLIWLTAKALWGEKPAAAAGWMAALFPVMVMYSALINREAYVWLFFMMALYGVVEWRRSPRLSLLLLSGVGFVGATLFHGGIGLAVMAWLALLALQGIRATYKGESSLVFRVLLAVSPLLALYPLYAFLSGDLVLPKVGGVERMLHFEHIVHRLDVLSSSGSGYPSWVVPTVPVELLWKGPGLILYFLFSPFPWDIRSAGQLVGLVDGVLYLVLVVGVVRYQKAIFSSPGALWMVTILAVVLVVYSYGTGNYGTAIRHRSMVAGGLIVLAAPMLAAVMDSFRRRVFGPRHGQASGAVMVSFLDKEWPPEHSFVDGMLSSELAVQSNVTVVLVVSRPGRMPLRPIRYGRAVCAPALFRRKGLARFANLWAGSVLLWRLIRKERRRGRKVILFVRNEPVHLAVAALFRPLADRLVFQSSFWHENDESGKVKPWVARTIYRLSSSRVDALLAVSPLGLSRMQAMFPEAEADGYIPLLCDVSPTIGGQVEQGSIKKEGLRFIYIGTHRANRGLEMVLKAIVVAIGEGCSASFVFVGGSVAEIEPLRSVPGVAALIERGMVTFQEKIPRSEIPSKLLEAEVGLSLIPLRQIFLESSPTKLAEYMGSGLAVLANRGIPMQEQFVEESQGGLLVEWDVAAMADGIRYLSSHWDVVAEMKKKAYGYACSRLQYSNYLPVMERLIAVGEKELPL